MSNQQQGERLALGGAVRKQAGDNGTRYLEGFVSNDVGEVDRQGDHVDQGALMRAWERAPHGALPLLWGHDANEPIGSLVNAETRQGRVWGRAALLPAGLSVKADLAWNCLSMSPPTPLGFSIGFRPLNEEDVPAGRMDPGGIWRWTNLDWLETSVVATPAAASSLAVAAKAFNLGLDWQRPWLPAERQAEWAQAVEKAAKLESVHLDIEAARQQWPRYRDGNQKRAGRNLRSARELVGVLRGGTEKIDAAQARDEALAYHEQEKALAKTADIAILNAKIDRAEERGLSTPVYHTRRPWVPSTDELIALDYLRDAANIVEYNKGLPLYGGWRPVRIPTFDEWRNQPIAREACKNPQIAGVLRWY